MKVSPMKDVRVPVEVILGGTTMSLEDFSSLGPGTIIELNRIAGEPVDLVAGGNKIALGEVVVIDESFGIRITKVHDERS